MVSEAIVVACIVAVPSTLAGLAALVVSLKGNRMVNGRLTELIASVKAEGRAEGHAAGVEDERNRA